MFPMVSSLSSDPRFALRQALATLLCMGYCCTSLPLAAAYALLVLVMPLLAATCLLARNPAGAMLCGILQAH
jgi:hypothetical protein